MNDSRIKNRWPIAKEGVPFILAGCGITLFFIVLGWLIPSIFFCLIALFVLFFFRDPERKSDMGNKAVLTPADGKVLEIKHLPAEDHPLGQSGAKVSIFMSLFNVHVNRVPIKGTVQEIRYSPGKFFSANLDKASKYNEKNWLTLETVDSQKLVFVQIAGIIARRIVCWIKEGDRVDAGQRFGLIRFGSRLEVFFPPDSHIVIKEGERAKAGKTVIGYLP
ncbi:MAG: phosphatidylserine decarboxylase family protein [Thermodesulfobacteriota bacterium]